MNKVINIRNKKYVKDVIRRHFWVGYFLMVDEDGDGDGEYELRACVEFV